MAIYNFIASATGAAAGAIQAEGTTYLTGAAGLIGIWSLDTGKYLDGSDDAAAFVDDVFVDDASDGDTADIAQRYIKPQRFQISQQRTSGQAYATPIIYGKDVTEVSYTPAVAAAAAAKTVVVNGDPAATTVNKIKVIVQSTRVDYHEFVDSDQLSLSAMKWKPGAIFNYEFTGVTTIDALGALVVSQMNALDTPPVTVAYNAGTNTLTFTAKQMGMEFDILVNPDGLAAEDDFNAPAVSVAMEYGHGAGAKVRSMEKKSVAHFGYHNRIWLNKEPELFGTGHTVDYDCVSIKAKNRYNQSGVYDTSFKNGLPGDITVNLWIDAAWTDQTSDLADACNFTVAGGAVTYTFVNGVGIVNG